MHFSWSNHKMETIEGLLDLLNQKTQRMLLTSYDCDFQSSGMVASLLPQFFKQKSKVCLVKYSPALLDPLISACSTIQTVLLTNRDTSMKMQSYHSHCQ